MERDEFRRSPQAKTATLYMEDATWARRLLENNRLGANPRKLGDVVQQGEVVMVELLPPTPAQGRPHPRPHSLGRLNKQSSVY